MQDLIAFVQNHVGLIAALATALLALAANEVHGNLRSGKKLSPGEAVRMINDHDALVLDVRPATDFKKGHLLGAVNIPGDKLKDRLGDLFAGNNRVNAARITFDDGTFVEVSFPDPQRGWTRFEWIPKRTRTLTFTVNSVHRGTRWNDLAISEVRILRVK